MKKLLLLTALLTTSVQALPEDVCNSIKIITKNVMELRNADVNQQSVKDFLHKKAPTNTHDLLDLIVKQVYSENIPKGTDPETISNLIYYKCIE